MGNFQGRLDSRTQLNPEQRERERIAAANEKAIKDAEAANAAAAAALYTAREALVTATEYKGPRTNDEPTPGERLLSYCDPITDREKRYSQAMCVEVGTLALAAANQTLEARGEKPLTDAADVELVFTFLINKNVWPDLGGDAVIAALTCLKESGALKKFVKIEPLILKVPPTFPGDPVTSPDAYSRWERDLLKQEQDEIDVKYISESPVWQAALESICTTADKIMDWPSALRLLQVWREMSAHETRHGRPMREDVAGIRRAATALWGNIGELSVEAGEKAFSGLTAEEQRSLLNSADQRDPRYATTGQWHDSRTMRQ